MSRQLAARTALGVLCPLLQLAPDAVAGGPIFPGEEAASGMLGARRVTVAELEAKEVATLRQAVRPAREAVDAAQKSADDAKNKQEAAAADRAMAKEKTITTRVHPGVAGED